MSDLLAIETEHYWGLARDLKTAVEAGDDVSELIDELDVLSIHASKPKIRSACESLIEKHQPAEKATAR